MKNLMLIFFAMTLIPSISFAAKNIWRDCGIGALIFTETKWAAVTSNIIWDLGITGSSSTSSSQDQCAGKGASTANFIYENYAILEEETAIGEGPHLVTMLNILGCKSFEHNQIIGNIRSSFSNDLKQSGHSSKSKLQKAKVYYDNVIRTSSKQCATI